MASVKLRMSQNPNIAIVLLPGNIGLTSPPAAILAAMIPLPASPNPKANSPPILIIVFSKILVSNDYYSILFFSNYSLALLSLPAWSFMIWSFKKASYSSIWAASRGLLAIFFTFSNMISIGLTTKSLVSLEK